MQQTYLILSLIVSLIAQPTHGALAPSKTTHESQYWSLKNFLNDIPTTSAGNNLVIEELAQLTAVDTTTAGIAELRKKIDTICSVSPISTLTECDSEKCPLTRKNNFVYRALYEAAVVEELHKKLATKEHVVYTSFACGSMLQDFIILTNVLMKAPAAQITIHLIDSIYTILAGLLSKSEKSTKISKDSFNVASAIVSTAIYVATDCAVNDFTKRVFLNFLIVEKRAVQFTTMLKKLFPKARLEVFIHSSANGYMESITENSLEHADILVASDINDVKSQQSKAQEAYFSLCKSTSLKNESMVGIYLAQKSWLSPTHLYVLRNK